MTIPNRNKNIPFFDRKKGILFTNLNLLFRMGGKLRLSGLDTFTQKSKIFSFIVSRAQFSPQAPFLFYSNFIIIPN